MGWVAWEGTSEESQDLVEAIGKNCTCPAANQNPETICPAHRLLRDETFLKHCLFVRREFDRLFWEREFAPWEPADPGDEVELPS